MHTTSIRDFTKEKVLGKGSFGSVFLVRRKRDNKIYALKSVYMEKLNKKEQENSVNEVRILASVNHPNVIGYKEAFWDDSGSTLNIVMEYADDGDLHTKIERMEKEGGLFSEDLVWSYSIQMIEGLKALHDKKIMHRDLKSANIFLVKDKHQCKIGDMNVSKVIKEKVLRTQTGTPYYASPEVWNDNPYSYKSDLWSIGCVIYELCELKPPFHGKDLDELYENVCKGKPKRINKIYSDELWQMILMLLQVDVEKRVDCNKFLNSDLILKKIKEMKENPKTHQEAESLDKNKNTQDDFLLKTIKFDDIKEIKSQLPSKKNYAGSNKSGINLKKKTFLNKGSNDNSTITKSNNINKNEQYIQKLKNVEKEKENLKKDLSKQIGYEKVRESIKKNIEKKKKEKEKEKENNKKVSRTINRVKDYNDYLLKHHQTVVYKKGNIPIPSTDNRESLYKSKHPQIDIINNNNSSRRNLPINSERRKQTDLSDLYIKKYGKNFNKVLLNSKLSEASLLKKEHLDYNSDKADTYNNINYNLKDEDINNDKYLTSVERMKKINLPKESEDESDKRNTINSNTGNKGIYNKKNIHSHIKKIDIDLEGKKTDDRRQSATPVYKRSPLLNPILSQSNKKIPSQRGKIIFPSNKIKKLDKITSPQNRPKANQLYSFGIAMTSPSLLNNNINKENEIEQISITSKDKKYIKKNNLKAQIDERDKQAKLAKKRLNVLNDNNNNENPSGIALSNSNAYLRNLNNININTPKKALMKCYLSPKCNNSQVFNNFYSINMGSNVNAPLKVINVYKK